MTRDMEIMSVGNELLIGKIVNTNAQWLAKRATTLGIEVKRITVMPDNVGETAVAIKETLRRKPQFFLITGGMGATFDDKTLETIANALGNKLEVNQEALQMVKQKYQEYATETGKPNTELTAAQTKMATLPENAKPIPNPVGTAPGVQINLKRTTLIAMPGVPREMVAIFDKTVEPLLRQASGGINFFEASLFVDGVMESVLAPLIDMAMRDNPKIYIKSHPQGEENKPHIEIHLSTTASNEQEAMEHMQESMTRLTELVTKSRGKVLSEKQIQRDNRKN